MWVNRKEFEELKSKVNKLVVRLEKEDFIKKNKPKYKFSEEVDGFTVVEVNVIDNKHSFIEAVRFGLTNACNTPRYRYEYKLSNGKEEKFYY